MCHIDVTIQSVYVNDLPIHMATVAVKLQNAIVIEVIAVFDYQQSPQQTDN